MIWDDFDPRRNIKLKQNVSIMIPDVARFISGIPSVTVTFRLVLLLCKHTARKAARRNGS